METDQTYSALTRCRGHQEQEWVDDGVDEAGADLPLLDGGQAHVGGAVGGVGDHGQDGVSRFLHLHSVITLSSVLKPFRAVSVNISVLLLVTKYRASSDDYTIGAEQCHYCNVFFIYTVDDVLRWLLCRKSLK